MLFRKKKILFVATEASPYTKVGGLGEVMYSLPKALVELGHDARVFIPKYGKIDEKAYEMKTVIEKLNVPAGDEQGQTLLCNVKIHRIEGQAPAYFLENMEYYEKRANEYGYSDDPTRFALLSRGAIEFVKNYGEWTPDVINFSDWHTGFGANYLATEYKNDPKLSKIATVFSIHNLCYQGNFDHRYVSDLDYDDGKSRIPSLFDQRLAKLNGMRRGIMHADIVNTVSEKYAQEILTEEYGEKLDQLLKESRWKLSGVLNGLDQESYNPKTDTFISQNYDVYSIDKKRDNKIALQKELGLPIDPEIPVICMVTRLDSQKGLDLIGQIMEPIMDNLRVQFVIMGGGDGGYREYFEKLREKYPASIGAHLMFDFNLPRLFFAGSDMILVPSRFEPCGIVQLEAMRYGTVPIVRATGGLADTVVNFDPDSNEGYGFVFEKYDSLALYTQIVRAVEIHKNKKIWNTLVKKTMRMDFSWKVSAEKYIGLYRKAMQFHNSTQA
ncbi:glycogen synthase [Patescibacteria group bacterium]|nr:glycogen synthase [Patescibacteria group bacterium]MBU4353136.1 glycogen synthase [Patescibacteria group bacterium]MBU4477249.1 glycogen synthase [Patescibacteria group bacterium]MCG2699350.1 glycogen synthase [Candidatus Parcubacteria bacterium]